MDVLPYLIAISLLGNICVSLLVASGLRRMPHVRDIPPLTGKPAPKVSVIIPACNEGHTMAPALESVLGMDYPDLEVLVINDRSTDNTGEVLEEMGRRYPGLEVYTVTELPRGWLGKSHALHVGAAQAAGEYLLFTDADVVMERTVLARAMQHVLTNRLDHLSMLFSNTVRGGLLNTLLMELGGGLLLFFKPWKAKEPRSRHFMGVGAFNLVKAETYRAVGGHLPIAMHPIDDVMLGRLIKEKGYSQDCLQGSDFVTVSWYGSVRELVRGLMKNVFAAYDYRVSLVLASIVFIFLMGILPFWGVFLATGPTFALCLAAVLVRLASFAKGFLEHDLPVYYTPWALVTPYIQIYIIVRATVITLVNRGITWRGTHYPLRDLKRR